MMTILSENFDNIQKCQQISLTKPGTSSDEQFACSENPGQIIWNKIEKSGKTGQNKKVWYLLFHVFLLLLPKFSFLKGDGALGSVSIRISDFLRFPCFLRS